jgi:hypothetical protein
MLAPLRLSALDFGPNGYPRVKGGPDHSVPGDACLQRAGAWPNRRTTPSSTSDLVMFHVSTQFSCRRSVDVWPNTRRDTAAAGDAMT